MFLRPAGLDGLPLRLRFGQLLRGDCVEFDEVDAGKCSVLVLQRGLFVLDRGSRPQTELLEVHQQPLRDALFGLDGLLDVAHEDGSFLGVVGLVGHER